VDQIARELRLVPPLSLSQAGCGANGAPEAIADAHAVADQRDKHTVEPDAASIREGDPRAEAQPPQPETVQPVKATEAEPKSDYIKLDRDFPAPPKSNSDDHTRTTLRSGPPRRRLRWYAIAAVIGLLLLALNTVYSSELANIYSTLRSANQRLVSSIQSMDLWPRRELNGAGFASGAANPGAAKTPVSNQEPPKLPLPELNATLKNGAFPEAVGKNSDSASTTPLPIEASTQPQTDAVPAKKPEPKPRALVFEVVGLSSVRAKPSAQADIIAELEPGRRVRILSRSRDYYQVQSLDDASIRGYVHREDAAFEQRNPSQAPTSR
jgi:hypothetical protein